MNEPADQPFRLDQLTTPTPPAARPQRRGMSTRSAILLAVGLIAAVALGMLGLTLLGRLDRPQVSMTSCDGDDNVGYISYELTNPTGDTKTYLVHAAVFAANGARIGDGSDVAANVAAGQTVRGRIVVSLAGDAATCRITGVD